MATPSTITAGDASYMQVYNVANSTMASIIYPLVKAGGATPISYRPEVPVTRLFTPDSGGFYTNTQLFGKITNLGTNSVAVQPYYEFENTDRYSTMFVLSFSTNWSATDGLNTIIFENPDTGQTVTCTGLGSWSAGKSFLPGNGAESYGNVLAIGIPELSTWSKVRIKFANSGSYTHAWAGFKSISSGIIFPWEPSAKILVQDGSSIKTLDGSSWRTVGSAPVTAAMYDDNPITNLNLLTNTVLQLLTSDSPVLLAASPVPIQCRITAIPTDKLVLPKGDISLSSADKLKNITLTTTMSGSGVVKIIVSVDGGTTWKTWDGSSWQTILPTESAASTSGITPSILNTLTETNWAALCGSGDSMVNTIRFGYYLSIGSSSENASSNSLAATLDMRGSWKGVPGKDFNYEYPRNNVLRVELYSNGDYKINY